MKIFVNNGAVIEHQVKKEIAPLSARQVLESRIKVEQDKIDGERSRMNRGSLFDKAEARKNVKLYTEQLDRKNIENLTPEARDMMWRRAKQLKDEFTVGMLTRDELHPVKAFMIDGVMKTVIDEEKLRALNSVKREQVWAKNNEEKIREYKNIMRHLCPDDPSATDIEKFRQRRRIG